MIDGRAGAVANYRKARQKVASYTAGDDLSLSDITCEWVKLFNEWLFSQGHEKSSISFYNRTVRAVYNKAVRKKIIRDKRPFEDVYTKSPVVHYPIKMEDDNGERLPFETMPHEDLLKRYKSLAYKYNCLIRKLREIMPS